MGIAHELVKETNNIFLDINGTIVPKDSVKREFIHFLELFVDEIIQTEDFRAAVSMIYEELCSNKIILMENEVHERIVQLKKMEKGEWKKEDIIQLLRHLVENDILSIGLRMMKGLIFQMAFKKSLLGAMFYPEVYDVIRNWFEKGKKISIFSDAASQTQQMLFKHTAQGDFTPYIFEFFDTSEGSKTVCSTYHKLLMKISLQSVGKALCEKSTPLFFTDSYEEMSAAKEAEWNVVIVNRDETNKPPNIKEIEDAEIKDFCDLWI